MFLRRYHPAKTARPTLTSPRREHPPDAGPRQRIVAYLGELNHDQERRWQRPPFSTIARATAQQLRLFPMTTMLLCPMIPISSVFVSRTSVGPTRAASATSGWHAGSGVMSAGRHRGPSPATGQTRRSAGRRRGHRSHQSPVRAVQRIRPRRTLVRCTALEDLLGVPDSAVTKDRLYRTLDGCAAPRSRLKTT